MQQAPDVAATATALFPPVGVPVGAMGAGRATLLSALDHLFAQPDLGPILRTDRSLSLELGAGQDQKTTEVVLVEVPDRVEQVAVEGHVRRLRAGRRVSRPYDDP